MRITRVLKKQILDDADWKCEYCGIDLNDDNATIDHKYPRSKGGTDDRDNLAAACRRCNMEKADKIIDVIGNPIAKQAAEAWIFAFKKSPKLTSILSLLATIIGIVITVYLNFLTITQRDNKLAADQNFSNQIQHLNETEANVKTLLTFIQQQRNQMVDNQNSLEKLKDEQNKLKPLVSADKKVVEALLAAQEARAVESAKSERWIGFGLGIVASIVASILLMIAQFFIQSRRNSS